MAEGSVQRRCCWGCCSVRTGTIHIAVLWLALNCVSIIACTGHLAVLSDAEGGNPWKGWWSWHDEKMAEAGYTGYGNFTIVKEMRAKIDDAYMHHRSCLVLLTWACIIHAAINTLFSALLLYGAVKNEPSLCNRRFLMPWFGYNIFGAVAGIVASIMLIIWLLIKFNILLSGIMAVKVVLIYAVYLSLFRVVWGYMQELKERDQEQAGFDEVGLVKN